MKKLGLIEDLKKLDSFTKFMDTSPWAGGNAQSFSGEITIMESSIAPDYNSFKRSTSGQ